RQTNRGGFGVRSIITSDRNGHVIGAISVSDLDSALMMSNTGQTVRISMEEVRVMGRSTQGVKLVNLHEGDCLVAVQKIGPVTPKNEEIATSEQGEEKLPALETKEQTEEQ
ncbi:MAG: hypothetical protein JSS09_00940, partial [Verrucomicrobia bacterium]|nr:hypothetical protein [Verrucomicrobiota bacterium]